jgi:hypothetical protein
MVKKPDIPTISEALERFLTAARAQRLSGETLWNYENLLNRRFLARCESKGHRYLKQLGVEETSCRRLAGRHETRSGLMAESSYVGEPESTARHDV